MPEMVDGAPVNYDGLPACYREIARNYIEHRLRPGSGWQAILSHDIAAVVICDAQTAVDLPKIYRWMHNHAPSNCHGSAAKVREWLDGAPPRIEEPRLISRRAVEINL